MKPKILIALLSAVTASAWAPAQASVVTDWNAITMVCVAGQVAPVAIPGNRPNPGGLLDIALVHAALHDAVQANQGRFEAYHYENSALRGVGSAEAAAAAAAYGVLVGLYGADDPCLATVTDPAVTYAGDPGLQAGNEAAAALLPLIKSICGTDRGCATLLIARFVRIRQSSSTGRTYPSPCRSGAKKTFCQAASALGRHRRAR